MHLRSVLSFIAFLIMLLLGEVSAQGNKQTIRGTILDTDTRQPLIGATVMVVGSDPIQGSTTDFDGKFVIGNVPTGRVDIEVL